MSFQLPSSTRTSRTRPAWSGMAVMVEAMVLLFFLVTSLAIITRLFAAASTYAREGEQLAEAIAIATTQAERFAADPATAEGTHEDGELSVTCEVTSDPTAAGTLYHAHIAVFDTTDTAPQHPVYTIETARYEQGVK